MARCTRGDRDSGLCLDVVEVIEERFMARCSRGDRDSGLWLDVVEVIERAFYG